MSHTHNNNTSLNLRKEDNLSTMEKSDQSQCPLFGSSTIDKREKGLEMANFFDTIRVMVSLCTYMKALVEELALIFTPSKAYSL